MKQEKDRPELRLGPAGVVVNGPWWFVLLALLLLAIVLSLLWR